MSGCEFLADLVSVAHAGYSLFVVVGLVSILSGMLLGWGWTKNRWFCGLHLAAVLFVVSRVWLGIPCPFSVAEDGLRRRTSEACPLGEEVHQILRRLAFRGADTHRFSWSSTVVGAVTAVAFVVSQRQRRLTPHASGRQESWRGGAPAN